jgi:hypothetical protein
VEGHAGAGAGGSAENLGAAGHRWGQGQRVEREGGLVVAVVHDAGRHGERGAAGEVVLVEVWADVAGEPLCVGRGHGEQELVSRVGVHCVADVDRELAEVLVGDHPGHAVSAGLGEGVVHPER